MPELKNKVNKEEIDTRINFILEKTNTGFSAYCESHPIFTTGKSMTKLISNIYEASELYFSNTKEKINQKNIAFEIDFKQFFQYYKILNARYLAERIGMNPTLLSQYVQGHKKPSKKQAEKILRGINQIGKELSEISLIQNQ